MTGLNVLYANQAMEERGWAAVPDRNKVSRLREVYWLKGVAPLGPKSTIQMGLSWRPDQGELGRRADLPGDGFAYVVTMFPRAEASFEWFEMVDAAMKARNGIASKQPVDFESFLGTLRKGRPSRVQQRKAADAVIAQAEKKLRKTSYCELMEHIDVTKVICAVWFDFDLSDLREMRFEDSELPEFTLRFGDVLICEGGSPVERQYGTIAKTTSIFKKQFIASVS